MRKPLVAVWMCVLGSVLSADGPAAWRNHDGERRDPAPLVIGHRGSTGYLPEHTLASYELAILQGVDYIEPDLVATRDGVLIARHEVNITDTTDVADRPEFAGRKTTKIIDGVSETGWFANDFTLSEIKRLYAKQRLGFRPQQFNGQYRVPTFDEVIELAQSWSRRTGRTIGVYPETKHPTYHASVGLPLERRLVRALERRGWNSRRAPVFIQSFEVGNLKLLNTLTPVKLVQLVDAYDVDAQGNIIPVQPYDFVVNGDSRTSLDLVTPQGLAEIATYADGVGPWKRYIVSAAEHDSDGDGTPDNNGDGAVNDSDKQLLPATDLIDDAHAAGLIVHTWTFRNEPRYLAGNYSGNPAQEYLQFFCLGIDGVFSDFPDSALSARDLLELSSRPCPTVP